MPGVIYWAGRTREVKDIVERAPVHRFANILLDELEARIVLQVGEVLEPSGQEIVSCQHAVSVGQQSVAQMRAEKTCSSGYQRTFVIHGRFVHSWRGHRVRRAPFC